MRTPRPRSTLRWSAIAGFLIVGALAAPPGARAHAELVTSEPPAGAQAPADLAAVVLRFSEPVDLELGEVRVLDRRGRRADAGAASQPTGSTVRAALRPTLPRGTYTVAWRVVSKDSHPISGAYVFGLGVTPRDLEVPAGARASPAAQPYNIAFGTVRFLHYAALLLLGGGTLTLVYALRDAPARTRRRLWGLLAASGAVVALTSGAGIVLQGVVAGDLGLSDALAWRAARGVIGTRFGEVWAWQAVAGAGAAILALALRRGEERSLARAMLLLSFFLLATPALTGHSSVRGAGAQLSAAGHVIAASVWTGGLVVLLCALLPTAGRYDMARSAVPVFSRLAFWSVIALVISGAVNSIVELDSVSALWTTTYGKLLLVKLAAVLPLIVAGAFHRRRLFDLDLGLVGMEVAIMAGIVAITAALVAEPPATAAPATSYAAETAIGPYTLTLTVDPARQGRNEVRLYVMRKDGEPAPIGAGTVTARQSNGGKPLVVAAVPAGPGRFVAPGLEIPEAGTWRIDVDVRSGRSERYSTTTPVAIR